MKSAYERAMEKIQKLGDATEEEKLSWKWVPEGKRLAAEFNKNNVNLKNELKKYEDKPKKYVTKGIQEVLASNIQLPKTETAMRGVDKSIEGLKQIHNGAKIDKLAERVKYVVTQYMQYATQQQKQAYAQLKEQVEGMMRQQGGVPKGAQVNVEAMPEFQREWMRIVAEIEKPFEEHLETLKKEILAL